MRENYKKRISLLGLLFAIFSIAHAQSFPAPVEVIFNYPVAESEAFAKTFGGDAISARLVQLVDSAKVSVDVAAYNFDHAPLASALRRAHSRGVIVRVVTDIDTQHPSLLSPTPEYFWLPVNVEGLMHHKFLLVDVEEPGKEVVLTGSCNFTDANIYRFYNDVIVLRSPVLAKAYRQEFELLWGSNTAIPNARNSRSGAAKPRRVITSFDIAGIRGQLYFSPNDEVSDRIISVTDSATRSIGLQQLTFTHDPIGSALANSITRGVTVFGVVENFDDPSAEFNFLNSRGASLRAHTPGEVVHHKYGVFDAELGSAATVITGSHNWTYSAETFHDENALVMTGSAGLAQIYHRAARDRHCALGNGQACINQVNALFNPGFIVLDAQVFPNPSRGPISLRWTSNSQPSAPISHYRILDFAGREISAGVLMPGQTQLALDLSGIAVGNYAIQLGDNVGWSRSLPFLIHP